MVGFNKWLIPLQVLFFIFLNNSIERSNKNAGY